MFLPVGDAPNPKGVPFVTYTLIALNVAVYLFVNLPLDSRPADRRDPEFREYIQVMSRELGDRADARELVARASEYDLFSFEHGYRPAAPRLSALLTCMFLHGGLVHLLGNMLFLWIYGDNVERRVGGFAYLFWYLATGVAATLFHSLLFSSSEIPLVGASGAISGILGFYFVWFPRNRVRMLVFLPPFLMQILEIPARWVLGMFLVVDNLLPFLFAGDSGVANGAHIGGFIAGALVAWTMDRRGLAARPEGVEAPEAPVTGTGAVRAALADGRTAEAARAYFALPPSLARGALTTADAVELASWLRQGGHSDAALLLLRRVIRDVPRAEGLAEVYALAGTILLEDQREPAAAYQYLLTALDLGPRAETAVAVRRELATIAELQKRQVGRLHAPPRW